MGLVTHALQRAFITANNTKDKSKDTSDSSALTYEIEPVFHRFLRYYLGCVFPDAHDAITQRLEGHVSAQAAQLVHSAQLPEEALHMLQHKLVVGGNHNVDDVTWTAERLHVLLVLKSKDFCEDGTTADFAKVRAAIFSPFVLYHILFKS